MKQFSAISSSFAARLAAFLRLFRSVGARLLSSDGQQRVTAHVVGQITQTNFSSDPDHANAAHQRTAGAHCHYPEDVFNTATNLRSASIALLFLLRQFPVPAALALQVFTNK